MDRSPARENDVRRGGEPVDDDACRAEAEDAPELRKPAACSRDAGVWPDAARHYSAGGCARVGRSAQCYRAELIESQAGVSAVLDDHERRSRIRIPRPDAMRGHQDPA